MSGRLQWFYLWYGAKITMDMDCICYYNRGFVYGDLIHLILRLENRDSRTYSPNREREREREGWGVCVMRGVLGGEMER